jgi:light-regulated signal transduction histidine kinase (bacteriophytochrome)
MDRLIDDLLNYTRIEHKAVRFQLVALQPLVAQILQSLSERISETSATVTVVENLPVIEADRTLIGQILINLLDNALTYRRAGVNPLITIDCSSDKNSVVISVTDNGIGIAKKNYERIFNIFQRLHSDEEYSGTGIGLAIVKKSTDLMGGLVWVESVEGEGSTFYVKVPVQR